MQQARDRRRSEPPGAIGDQLLHARGNGGLAREPAFAGGERTPRGVEQKGIRERRFEPQPFGRDHDRRFTMSEAHGRVEPLAIPARMGRRGVRELEAALVHRAAEHRFDERLRAQHDDVEERRALVVVELDAILGYEPDLARTGARVQPEVWRPHRAEARHHLDPPRDRRCGHRAHAERPVRRSVQLRADRQRPPGLEGPIRVADLPELLAERDLRRRVGEPSFADAGAVEERRPRGRAPAVRAHDQREVCGRHGQGFAAMIYNHQPFEDAASIRQAHTYIGFSAAGAFRNLRTVADHEHLTADEIVVEGRLTGQHVAEFQGFQPTGRDVELPFVAFYRFDGDGKLVSERVVMNLGPLAG